MQNLIKFWMGFWTRKSDDIMLVVLGLVIGLLFSWILKSIKFVFKRILNLFGICINNIKKKYRKFKRRRKGEYTLGELERLQKLPKNKLTPKEKEALEKAEAQIKLAFSPEKLKELTSQINIMNFNIPKPYIPDIKRKDEK